MMKIKCLHRAVAERVDGRVPILAGNLAGIHQRLEGSGKKAAREEIENSQSATAGQSPDKTAKGIVKHCRGIDTAAPYCMERHELMAGSKLVLKAGKQMRLSMPCTRCLEKYAMPGLFQRGVEP